MARLENDGRGHYRFGSEMFGSRDRSWVVMCCKTIGVMFRQLRVGQETRRPQLQTKASRAMRMRGRTTLNTETSTVVLDLFMGLVMACWVAHHEKEAKLGNEATQGR